LNENIEISHNKGLFDTNEDSYSCLNLKESDDLKKAEFEVDKMNLVDWLSIFNKQPTQLNNLNNKLKTNKDMENAMIIDEFQANPFHAEKIDNEIQMLNRKRKQSDGFSELRKESLAKLVLNLFFFTLFIK
jgi:uncharacterized protein involved in exopolysaccharide biosynthesis